MCKVLCYTTKVTNYNLRCFMGLFEFLFGDSGNQNRKYRNKARDQEMANMYESGWDEMEDSKYDRKALEREKWSNYEYDDEDEKY